MAAEEGEDGRAGAINPTVETKTGSRADLLQSGTFSPAWTCCHNVPSGAVFLGRCERHPFFFLAKSAALGIKATENDIEFCRTIRSLDKNGCGDEMYGCHLNGKNLP